MSDTIERAKTVLAKALRDEIEALNPRIKEIHAQLDKLEAERGELILQLHQVTRQDMAEIAGPVEERSQAAWRARNAQICRLFLTTDMNQRELAKRYGVTSTTIGMILFHAGIVSDTRPGSIVSMSRRKSPHFGNRRRELPADLQEMIAEDTRQFDDVARYIFED